MNYYLLSSIIIWSVFWLAYALYTYNAETFYYKLGKKSTKKEKPILFHAEVIVSFLWSLSGYAILFSYLKDFILYHTY